MTCAHGTTLTNVLEAPTYTGAFDRFLHPAVVAHWQGCRECCGDGLLEVREQTSRWVEVRIRWVELAQQLRLW